MPTGSRRPSILLAPFVEWRANRIHDPVEKLRFLRDASTFQIQANDIVRLNGPLQRRTVFIAMVIFLIPRPTVSDAISKYREQLAALSIGTAEKFANVWLVDRNEGY